MIARAVVFACLLPGCGLFAGREAADVRIAYDTALHACAACADPIVTGSIADACADLEPVCAALAGVCVTP